MHTVKAFHFKATQLRIKGEITQKCEAADNFGLWPLEFAKENGTGANVRRTK